MKARLARTIALLSMGAIVCACGLLPSFTVHFPDRTVQVEIPDTGGILRVTDFDDSEVIHGNGDRVTVYREISDFERISIMGLGDVKITQDKDYSLSITVENNLLEYIQTDIEEGTLILGYDPERARYKDLRPSKDISFEISVPYLSGIAIYGSADVQSEALEVDRFSIDVYGSGDFSVGNMTCQRMSIDVFGVGEIEIDDLMAETLSVSIPGKGTIKLAGEVNKQEIDLPGFGNYLARNLKSQTATVRIPGLGDAKIWVTDELYAEITGGGNIHYYGNPRIYHLGPGGDLESLGNP